MYFNNKIISLLTLISLLTSVTGRCYCEDPGGKCIVNYRSVECKCNQGYVKYVINRWFSEDEEYCYDCKCGYRFDGLKFPCQSPRNCVCGLGYRSTYSGCIGYDICQLRPCYNGGSCQNNGSSFSCQCAPGYYGERCEKLSTPCFPNPCRNNGRCAMVSYNVKCYCPPSHTGPLCEIEVNPCTSKPCLNDGICQKISYKDYNCQCPVTHHGKNCDIVAIENMSNVNKEEIITSEDLANDDELEYWMNFAVSSVCEIPTKVINRVKYDFAMKKEKMKKFYEDEALKNNENKN